MEYKLIPINSNVINFYHIVQNFNSEFQYILGYLSFSQSSFLTSHPSMMVLMRVIEMVRFFGHLLTGDVNFFNLTTGQHFISPIRVHDLFLIT